MQPLFEYRCKYNKKIMAEGAKCRIKPSTKAIYSIILSLVIIALILSQMMTRISYWTCFFFSLLIFILRVNYDFKRKAILKPIKNMPFDNNGEILCTIDFFDHELKINNILKKESAVYNYNQFYKVQETKNTISLLLKNGGCVIVTKDSMSPESIKSFRMFLVQVSMAYNIKIKLTDIDYSTDSYRDGVKKRTALTLFIILGVLLTIAEIIYRIRIVPKGIHFIYGWMEILMIGIILFCFISSAVSYIHIDKKIKRAVIITAAALCAIPALILSVAVTETIVKFSPDRKHVLAVDRNNGNTVVNNTYYYIFKSPKEQLPYTADGKMKYQWLCDDICAITYNSTDDSNTHQYIQTFGDRGDGISYNDPFTAVSGSWQIADQNHTGWELKVENGCIIIKNGSYVWSYQSSDCVRFGTCAMVLCKGGIPEWSLALNPDCRINYDCLIANGGTITLCRVLMDETTTFTFECTDAKDDYSDVNPSLNDNAVADENVEIEDTIHRCRNLPKAKTMDAVLTISTEYSMWIQTAVKRTGMYLLR